MCTLNEYVVYVDLFISPQGYIVSEYGISFATTELSNAWTYNGEK